MSRLTCGHIQHMYSWWWVRLSPETCRVKPLRRIKTQLFHLVGLISLPCLLELNGNFRHVYHHHLFRRLTVSTINDLLLSTTLQCLRINRKPSTLNHREMSPVNRTKYRYRHTAHQHPPNPKHRYSCCCCCCCCCCCYCCTQTGLIWRVKKKKSQ